MNHLILVTLLHEERSDGVAATLWHRTSRHPDRIAYTFLEDGKLDLLQ